MSKPEIDINVINELAYSLINKKGVMGIRRKMLDTLEIAGIKVNRANRKEEKK